MSLVSTKIKAAAAVVVMTGLLSGVAGTAVRAYQATGTPAPRHAPALAASGAVVDGPAREGVELEKKAGPKDLAISETLKKSVSLNLEKRPLGEAITSLREQTGLNIVMDVVALSRANVTTGSPVTLQAERIRLECALRCLLLPLGLTYKVQDEVLLITSPPEAAPGTLLKTYYVGDLIAPSLKFRRMGNRSRLRRST